MEPGIEVSVLRQKLDAELLRFVDKAEHGNGHPIGVRGRVKMGSLYFATLALAGTFLLITCSEPKLHGRYVEAVGWAFILVLGAFLGWHVLKAVGRLLWRLAEVAIEPLQKSRVDTLAAENEALKKKLAEYAPITDGGYRIAEACKVGDAEDVLEKVLNAGPASKPALLRSKTKEWGTGT
jgi:hypothetical protein